MILLALLWTITVIGFAVWSRSNYLGLPSIDRMAIGRDKSDTGPVDVTVIVPARNEAHQIARVVKSFPDHRVLVIDDASVDETATVARQSGAEVISAPPLSVDRKGKPNACLEGARHATSQWLLFVDADTWYQPGFAEKLIRYAESQQVSVVTAFLKQEMETIPEKLILPYAFGLYFCGVSAKAVNDPKAAEALANGQCLLFRRDVYQSTGGHALVSDSVIEDVALASRLKQLAIPIQVVRAEALGSVRMYDSLAAIFRGFQKNSFRFLLVNKKSGLLVIAASVTLTSLLPLMGGLLQHGEAWLALALILVPALAFWPWFGGGWALLTSVAIYAFQVIALSAMWATLSGQGSVWKGRRV
jgi:glycosyltransferase involved in cell wall biosynthesis